MSVSKFHGLRVALLAATVAAAFPLSALAAPPPRPNIIFILADDMGWGDIGPYGQKKIHTPTLDRLADEGMLFTDHYSGHSVCSPSRCTLLSGKHPGHAYIRMNRDHIRPPGALADGQEPVPAGELHLPLTLQHLGYVTGAFGKWGLGAVGTSGDPIRQGFDRFFGFNDQVEAHNYYPDSLWDNDRRVPVDNPAFSAHQKLAAGADPAKPESYARFAGRTYAPDVINAEARRFIRENRERPFFVYYPTTVPHSALQVPADSLAEYAGKFPEKPYLAQQDYLPNRTPHAAFAAMITRLDRNIGRLLALIDELGLREQTIVVFTSDNGPIPRGGSDPEFFNSTGGFRGYKGTYYEGGFRVPCIVRWPGHIPAGARSDRVTGFEDWLPTFCELIGAPDAVPPGLDGISFAPTLLGHAQQPRPFLYRETPNFGGQQAVRVGNWKAIHTNLNPGPMAKSRNPNPIELYDLATDPHETHDLAAQHPDIVERLARIMQEQHTKSDLWPIRAIDGQP